MSTETETSRWLRPMRSRNPHEIHRAATPLELFFDLCFVVAIALAATELHHGWAHGHVWEPLRDYALIFFAIWWAWMNFSWFASAYDTDDAPYRLGVFVQMAGALIIAAGVPRAFEHQDFRVITLGYAVMRVAQIALWLRAARTDKALRSTSLRYALGLTLCQVGWISMLALPAPLWIFGWFVLAPAELLVPVIAERAGQTTWNAHHIAERYGLLTLIVLGETVLASTVAIQTAIDGHALSPAMIRAIAGGLLILFSMWWLYFCEPAAPLLTSSGVTFSWGYAHYLVFGSVAAVGAAMALYTDFLVGEAHISRLAASAPLAGAITLFVLLVWGLHQRLVRGDRVTAVASVVAALAVPATCFTPWPVLGAGIVLTMLVLTHIWRDQH